MVARNFEDWTVSRMSNSALSPKLAAILLIVAACALGACGRKGALDPPPGASAAQVEPSGPDDGEKWPTYRGVDSSQYGTAGTAATAQGNVFDPAPGANPSAVAPPGARKRIFLDPILD